MGIFSGLFRSRDKPKDSYDSPSYSYFFGRTHAGKRVNDRTAMQIIAVYACVRVLSEAIAAVPCLYRIKFRRDIYKDFAALQTSVQEGDEEGSNLDI